MKITNMNSHLLVRGIRDDLNKLGSTKGKKSFQRFFKDKVKCYGIKSADTGNISKKYWQLVSDQSKDIIFDICEILFSSDYSEEAFIASSFSYNKKSEYKPEDFKIFENWIEKYINN